MESIEFLSNQILAVHNYFQTVAVQQVNNALTFRNWFIGCYLVEYEQNGKDRADYGEKTLKVLSDKMKHKGFKGFSDRNLRLYRQFYLTYPQIWQLAITKFQNSDNQSLAIWQLGIAKSHSLSRDNHDKLAIPVEVLISKLTYTHFVEFIKIDEPLKRIFYEVQALKNNWTIEQLKRQINSMLYERIGLSKNKESILAKLKNENSQQMNDVIRNPFILEFLGIPERYEYSETDIEQAIINNLQNFLIEMGRGFCFEARQKRISFNNRHYRIDLIFYHRILKCHVLIDLKIGEFDHADAGQMNMYLNYYRENEMAEYDNPPVGILLCTTKDDALVHYATGNLPQEVFVSNYMLQMPDTEKLKQIIQHETRNI
jgi:predicted nuclease of restriction endonuclease-like (RecB) superfamily